MGRKSQERRTGKTYTQRSTKPNGNIQYDIGNRTRKEEHNRRKEHKIAQYFAQLMKSGKLEGYKEKVET